VGWHLIGTVNKPVDFSNPVVNPAGSIIACYGYEPSQKKYYSVYPAPPGTGFLEPQQGFWLAVSQECDLTIGGTPQANMAAMTNKAPDLGFSKQFGLEPPAPPDALVFHQDICSTLPKTFKLLSNFPNPFNPQTTIMYDLPSECLVTVEIFNIVGQRIRLLSSGIQGPGHIQQMWNGRDEQGKIMDSGIYLYRIIAFDTKNGKNVLFKQTKKMLLVK
ncbi:MAG: T9SS type A sorting domain-containing protein, partial [Candidatus Aminicenantes bacterium]|nr:T9SS type A sorting domain-containing protein [Candidatus Aminicenantes bacterium]